MPTPINGLPNTYSESSPDTPHLHLNALANALDSRLVPRFASVTARDAAITSPVNGMMCWVDTPAGWYQRVGGAWRFTPAVVPMINGGLQRTDGSAAVNAGNGATANDTYLRALGGAQEGTWTTFNNGAGVGMACSVPGWYVVDGLLPVAIAHSGNRWENLRINGTHTAILGGGSAASGFSDPGGSVRLKCPSGISVIFTYQQTATSDGVIRSDSRFSIAWVAPVTS